MILESELPKIIGNGLKLLILWVKFTQGKCIEFTYPSWNILNCVNTKKDPRKSLKIYYVQSFDWTDKKFCLGVMSSLPGWWLKNLLE